MDMKTFFLLSLCVCMCGPAAAAEVQRFDVVVYGGTSGGAAAAVQAARMGKIAVLIEPGRHVGGMTSGGLGMTDSGNPAVIGGLSREFYQRVEKHYAQPAAWTRQVRTEYRPFRAPADARFRFEPHVAEKIFGDMLREAGVKVVTGERLDLRAGVKKTGTRITEIVMESGIAFRGRHVHRRQLRGRLDGQGRCRLRRRPREQRPIRRDAQRRPGAPGRGHQFLRPVDPFVKPGDPAQRPAAGHQPRSAAARRRRRTSASRPTASACA